MFKHYHGGFTLVELIVVVPSSQSCCQGGSYLLRRGISIRWPEEGSAMVDLRQRPFCILRAALSRMMMEIFI